MSFEYVGSLVKTAVTFVILFRPHIQTHFCVLPPEGYMESGLYYGQESTSLNYSLF